MHTAFHGEERENMPRELIPGARAVIRDVIDTLRSSIDKLHYGSREVPAYVGAPV